MNTAVENLTPTLEMGDAVVDRWTPVTDGSILEHMPSLASVRHLWDEGRMLLWELEFDTKYSRGEAVGVGDQWVARFWPPAYWDEDLYVEEEWYLIRPTEFTVAPPADGREWTLWVLGGRYDHYVALLAL